jgi:hypothetical protein
MNIFYYITGAVLTFVGILIQRFFINNMVLQITTATLFEVGIIAGIAALAFFIADYVMSRIAK